MADVICGSPHTMCLCIRKPHEDDVHVCVCGGSYNHKAKVVYSIPHPNVKLLPEQAEAFAQEVLAGEVHPVGY